MSDDAPRRKQHVQGWLWTTIFFLGMGWVGRERYHLVEPGQFVLLLLAASAAYVAAIWFSYRRS